MKRGCGDRKEEMNDLQRQLARHALGFPNKKNTSYRNHFCTGPGSTDHEPWLQMVAAGEAIRRTGPLWGGDDMFHLTLEGALKARDPKEHLSREETELMRTFGASGTTVGEEQDHEGDAIRND
jgi:hypothetical protein